MSDPTQVQSSLSHAPSAPALPSGPYIEDIKGDSPELGTEVFIHPSAAVIGKVYLGDRVSIWPQVTLRGDEGEIRIGADTNIQDGSTIHMTGGYSETMIGSRVTVGHMCLLHGCKIGDDCLIGMGSLLLDRSVIGEGSYVAAGTMITGGKVIPPNSFVMGRPGNLVIKPISTLRSQERDYSWRHYVQLAQEYLSRNMNHKLSTLLVMLTLGFASGSMSGCAPSQHAYQAPSQQTHHHHITFATLKQQNLYDYSLFADTELDLFSHRREIISLTRQQPLTINYRSFSSPRVDYLIERAQSLYAQYRFASNAVDRFRNDLIDLYGERLLNMQFDELQAILSQDGEASTEETLIDATPEDKLETQSDSSSESASDLKDVPDEVDQTGSPGEGVAGGSVQLDKNSPRLTPKLIQGARAVRLAIAGHQDLVARAVRAKIELDGWEKAAEDDLAHDLNLINVRPLMRQEINRARQSLDALMSGAPLLSKSMSEVSAAAAAVR